MSSTGKGHFFSMRIYIQHIHETWFFLLSRVEFLFVFSCFFPQKITIALFNVMHWRPTSVYTNEGSSFRERTQRCAAAFNIEVVGCENTLSPFPFFRVKMKAWWGSVGRRFTICCGLLLLHLSVALQSVLVYTGSGVVHIRPWLRMACCHIWLCSP